MSPIAYKTPLWVSNPSVQGMKKCRRGVVQVLLGQTTFSATASIDQGLIARWLGTLAWTSALPLQFFVVQLKRKLSKDSSGRKSRVSV